MNRRQRIVMCNWRDDLRKRLGIDPTAFHMQLFRSDRRYRNYWVISHAPWRLLNAAINWREILLVFLLVVIPVVFIMGLGVLAGHFLWR